MKEQKETREKLQRFIAALDEHLSEAQREEDPLMTDLYQTFLNALRFRRHEPDGNGKLTIILELRRGK